jgi:tRNA-dihydrouridine synthase 1
MEHFSKMNGILYTTLVSDNLGNHFSPLICVPVNTLHKNLSIPVTAKFRVFSTVEKTVEYAKMLESAGAQILTCHGRTREQRGHSSVRTPLQSLGCHVTVSISQGLADWAKIRAVKDAVSIPVFANGNILYHSDIQECLRITGADAVMSAEGQLYNAALFAQAQSSSTSLSSPLAFDKGLHPPHADLALEYLSIVKGLKTKTPMSAVKGHLFKLMRPALSRETDLRERLGKVRNTNWAIDEFIKVVEEMKTRMEVSVGYTSVMHLVTYLLLCGS